MSLVVHGGPRFSERPARAAAWLLDRASTCCAIRGGLADLARAMLRTTDKLVVLALAADHVLMCDRIVLKPHDKNMGRAVDGRKRRNSAAT